MIRQIYQRNKRWFKLTTELLGILGQTRGGGILTHFLAGVDILGKTVDTLYPEDDSWDSLEALHLQLLDSPIGGYLCDTLMKSNLSKVLLSRTMFNQSWIWEIDGVVIGAVYSGNKFIDGPFTLPQNENKMLKIIRRIVWKKGNDLLFTSIKLEASNKASSKFSVESMGDLSPYINEIPKEWYIDRIKRYPSGPRTIMFVGSTGVGKSILARHLSKSLNRQKLLKISSEVLRNIDEMELLHIVKFLSPTVLLLDDLDLKDSTNLEKLLAMLEILRDPNSLVIITCMIDSETQGSLYFPGMRPGRIDEIFVLPLPNTQSRSKILRHYMSMYNVSVSDELFQTLVNLTEDLSGAYLRELILRLSIHGIGSYSDEINNLKLTAPIFV